MRRLIALTLTLTLVAIAVIAPATAQEATPTLDYHYPYTPDPANCIVDELRPIDSFVDVLNQATPIVGQPTHLEVPFGRPADEATVAAALETMETYFACANAGDRHQGYSLWTDNQIDWISMWDPVPEDVLRTLLEATPEVVPKEERTTILAISSIRVLPDGRVAAFVAFEQGGIPPTTNSFILVEQDGRWMIDQGMDFIYEGPAVNPEQVREEAATPAD